MNDYTLNNYDHLAFHVHTLKKVMMHVNSYDCNHVLGLSASISS